MIGQPLRLERVLPKRRETSRLAPASVFGNVPVEELKPGATTQTPPDYFELNEGSFFEVAAPHVLASASVEHLRRLADDGLTVLTTPRRGENRQARGALP